jgi:hypothetical protein
VPDAGGRDADLFVALQRGDPEEVEALISRHRVSVEGPRQIAVRGGSVLVERDGKELIEQNSSTYVLDLERNRWTRKVSDD